MTTMLTKDISDVDSAAVRQMIAEADAEGGEYPLEDVSQELASVIEAARRRRPSAIDEA